MNDGAGDPKAEASAALAFGGEEGLAEAALNLRRDTAARVADRDAQAADTGIGPVAGAANADAEASVGQRGFDCVGDEVGEHLAHLAGIDDSLDRTIVLALDTEILFHDAAAIEGEDFLEEGVNVGADGAGGFTREVEGLAADLADAFEFTLGDGEIVFNRWGQALLLAEEVEEVGDRFEGVIDLVGDGSGEAADGDELLVFAQHHGCAVEFELRLSLQDAGLADLQGAGDGGGQPLHFASADDLGSALAENADGFAFGNAAAGEEDGDGRLSGASTLNHLAGGEVREAFGTGDDEVGGAPAHFIEEFAAVFREFDSERKFSVAGGGAHGMVRQCGTPQHQNARDG